MWQFGWKQRVAELELLDRGDTEFLTSLVSRAYPKLVENARNTRLGSIQATESPPAGLLVDCVFHGADRVTLHVTSVKAGRRKELAPTSSARES